MLILAYCLHIFRDLYGITFEIQNYHHALIITRTPDSQTVFGTSLNSNKLYHFLCFRDKILLE